MREIEAREVLIDERFSVAFEVKLHGGQQPPLLCDLSCSCDSMYDELSQKVLRMHFQSRYVVLEPLGTTYMASVRKESATTH